MAEESRLVFAIALSALMVADPKRPRQQDQDPGEQVLEHVLEREPDRHARDAERAEQQRSVQRRKDEGQRDQHPDSQHDPARQSCQNPTNALGLARPCQTSVHQVAQQQRQQHEHGQDDQAQRDVGQGEYDALDQLAHPVREIVDHCSVLF